MQSEIFQAFICYNFDDYGLELMKTPVRMRILWKGFYKSHNHQNYNK